MMAGMKIKFVSALALCGALLSACVQTEDQHTAPGFATKDTITSRYARPVAQIAAATATVLSRDGKLLENNIVNNTFKARINQATVWVKVSDIDGKLTEVRVQARGSMGGDIYLAAQIDKEIALQIQSTPVP